MKRFRRFLSDRVNGGLLAAMLVYALVFQAVVVGSARAGMVDDLLTGGSVHCVTAPPTRSDAGRGLDGCCSIACQTACAAVVALPDTSGAPGLSFAGRASDRLPVIRSVRHSPRHLGACRQARAPPYFSA